MTDAVIVSTARTPIGKAYRGGLNDTSGADLAAHAIRNALSRAGVDGGEIEDVIMGCAMQEGTTGLNVARRAALVAGMPVTAAGTTIDRQCSSGMQSMALLANAIRNDGVPVGIAGGIESISLVQNDHRNTFRLVDKSLTGPAADVYLPMIDTAENVAKRYGITREQQDEYGLESQRRVAAAREAGRFSDEIAPMKTRMAVVDKETKEISHREVEIAHDEGPRAETTAEGLAALKPVREGGTITAGVSSQTGDASAAMLIVSEQALKRYNLKPRARIHHMSVYSDDPIFMLTAPIPATRVAMKKSGMKLDDIDLVEINEAFAPVALAWLKDTGYPHEKTNVNGGAIALAHPLGATGVKLMTTLLHELERSGGRYGLQTMCEGGGVANVTIIERL